jgi:hypothetical protein
MFTTLYSESQQRPVTWAELRAGHKVGRASAEAYYEFTKIFPVRGDPVDVALITTVTDQSFTYRDSRYHNLSDSTVFETTMNAECLWNTVRIGCPESVLQTMNDARVWLAQLDGELKYQYLNLLQRGMNARASKTIGGLVHFHRNPRRVANEGIVNIFANIVDPSAVAEAGCDLNDFGMRIARAGDTTLERIVAMSEQMVEEQFDFPARRRMARNLKPGWHVLTPNHWYLLSDHMPHYAATLTAPQLQAARVARGRPHDRWARVATFNLESFFEPPPPPPLTPEQEAKRRKALDDLFNFK